jgi:cell fate (sporulation/competence/biofilm development) regulator YlbF (YheA/YmcA/DUF963 family)
MMAKSTGEELAGMNVYDTAYSLAKAIQKSAEYREMEAALADDVQRNITEPLTPSYKEE